MWHVWQWNEEVMLCEIHMHDFKSHFQQDFLAYCTRPVSVHLVMAYILAAHLTVFQKKMLSLKQHQNYVFLYPVWPYPPKNKTKTVFYTGTLYGLFAGQKNADCFSANVLFSQSFSSSPSSTTTIMMKTKYSFSTGTKHKKVQMNAYLDMDTQYAHFWGILHNASMSK